MATINLNEMFEKAKKAYPHGHREGDTTWILINAYEFTRNVGLDGILYLQARRDGPGGSPAVKTYSEYKVDEEELG